MTYVHVSILFFSLYVKIFELGSRNNLEAYNVSSFMAVCLCARVFCVRTIQQELSVSGCSVFPKRSQHFKCSEMKVFGGNVCRISSVDNNYAVSKYLAIYFITCFKWHCLSVRNIHIRTLCRNDQRYEYVCTLLLTYIRIFAMCSST